MLFSVPNFNGNKDHSYAFAILPNHQAFEDIDHHGCGFRNWENRSKMKVMTYLLNQAKDISHKSFLISAPIVLLKKSVGVLYMHLILPVCIFLNR